MKVIEFKKKCKNCGAEATCRAEPAIYERIVLNPMWCGMCDSRKSLITIEGSEREIEIPDKEWKN